MNNNITRAAMYEAITAAGIKLHPCNLDNTAPADDTSVYYLDTAELTGIYEDITEEQTPDTEEEEEEETMFNNYIEAVTEDAVQYIRDNYTAEEIAEAMTDRDEFAEKLNDEMWVADEVTGNGSASYTFDRMKAREYVLNDIDTVREALREFGTEADTIAEKFLDEEWEYFDVTARCYVLGQAIDAALDIIEAETKAA
jgi:hypothetical protein